MTEIQECFTLILIAPPIQIIFHSQHYGQSAILSNIKCRESITSLKVVCIKFTKNLKCNT